MQKLNQPYSEAERNQLERHITVKYYVEDSLGAGAETQAELVIFLLGEEEQTAEGYVRFLDEEYIDGIDENTYWGSEDKKSLLREMMERDSAEITWEE